jgi:hypothetical protein
MLNIRDLHQEQELSASVMGKVAGGVAPVVTGPVVVDSPNLTSSGGPSLPSPVTACAGDKFAGMLRSLPML